ncbi:MAG: hypothetical protein ACYCV4_20325 [Dermatophilaceae bacterium]
MTTRNGLPVTTVARTIADVTKTGVSTEHAERAIIEALERGLLTQGDVQQLRERYGSRVAGAVEAALNVRAVAQTQACARAYARVW